MIVSVKTAAASPQAEKIQNQLIMKRGQACRSARKHQERQHKDERSSKTYINGRLHARHDAKCCRTILHSMGKVKRETRQNPITTRIMASPAAWRTRLLIIIIVDVSVTVSAAGRMLIIAHTFNFKTHLKKVTYKSVQNHKNNST